MLNLKFKFKTISIIIATSPLNDLISALIFKDNGLSMEKSVKLNF